MKMTVVLLLLVMVVSATMEDTFSQDKRGSKLKDVLSNFSCRYLKIKGYLASNTKLKHLCFKTYHCNDVLSKQSCTLLKTRNECSKNSKLSQAYCPFTCNKCSGGAANLNCPNNKIPKNCGEVLKCAGGKQSGVYSIDPDGKGPFKVYCDQKTNGGGWTVFQKRKDGSVDFYRGWNDYKKGFGKLKGEFWLGLDKINRLTRQTRNRLRVELEDWKGKSAYAEYDYFAVASERSKYKLSLGKYKGNAGDGLSYHRGMAFTTKDRDNDKWKGNCAVAYNGAWWYSSCHYSNLNGPYRHGKHKSFADGMNWYQWKGYHYSAKRAEMKIRPV